MTEQERIREIARQLALLDGVDPMSWVPDDIKMYRDRAWSLMCLIEMVK